MGTPVAYLIDAEAKTASQLASGSDSVPLLVRAAAGIPRRANGAKKSASGSKKTTGSRKRASAKR